MRVFLLLFCLPFLSACAAGKAEASSSIGARVQPPSGGATIVIDAGHGGRDLGAKAHKPYCEEKRISLQTAMLVQKYLTQLGYRVVMTRASDAFVSLKRRVEIANKGNCELFVSLHFNSSRNTKASGIEVFFCEGTQNRLKTASSRKLASLVLSRLIRRTQAVSRGVKKGNFYVIRETEMPAILVEGGFISNAQERSRLKDAKHLDQIARAVADGIDSYFKKR